MSIKSCLGLQVAFCLLLLISAELISMTRGHRQLIREMARLTAQSFLGPLFER